MQAAPVMNSAGSEREERSTVGDRKMLTLEKFEEASEIVKDVTPETKLVYSDYYLSRQTGNKVYLKPENMQLTGAYKVRGADYKISTLIGGRTKERSDHRFRRKSCTGRGLCSKASLESKCSHRDAEHHSADQGEPYEELRRGSGA